MGKEMLFDFFLWSVNCGLMLGLTMGVLLLLRPVLKRAFSPQQRAVVWTGSWLYCGLWIYNRGRAVLPVTFQDLVVPRTGEVWQVQPGFLPTYSRPGTYHLALPGGLLVPIYLSDWILFGLLALWCAGVAAVLVNFYMRRRRMLSVIERRLLEKDDPLLHAPLLKGADQTRIWICRGLGTSFVRRPIFGLGCQDGEHEIYLQEELPPQRLELVLLHELQHIRLWHCWWKFVGTVCLVLHWWNPLVWLGFRYFCQDLELACDSAVMRRLEPGRRKEYARTLLELGTGRQLWEAPLSFGECDGAERVKALTVWRPGRWWRQVPAWLAVAALVLFFSGGHVKQPLVQDIMLRWEREGGGTAGFVQVLGQEMADELSRQGWEPGDGEPEPAEPLAVAGVWEAPDAFPPAALWVRSADGQWYHVSYGWWGDKADFFGVLNVNRTQPPDLSGARRLV